MAALAVTRHARGRRGGARRREGRLRTVCSNPTPEVDMPAVTRPPQSGRSFWRFVHDRNPFYLLSAVSMFAGCRAIISAVGVAPGDARVGGRRTTANRLNAND